ncbi:MAG: hypothetical protein ACK4MT_07380, partial [Thermaurantiacus tibetensis]
MRLSRSLFTACVPAAALLTLGGAAPAAAGVVHRDAQVVLDRHAREQAPPLGHDGDARLHHPVRLGPADLGT